MNSILSEVFEFLTGRVEVRVCVAWEATENNKDENLLESQKENRRIKYYYITEKYGANSLITSSHLTLVLLNIQWLGSVLTRGCYYEFYFNIPESCSISIEYLVQHEFTEEINYLCEKALSPLSDSSVIRSLLMINISIKLGNVVLFDKHRFVSDYASEMNAIELNIAFANQQFAIMDFILDLIQSGAYSGMEMNIPTYRKHPQEILTEKELEILFRCMELSLPWNLSCTLIAIKNGDHKILEYAKKHQLLTFEKIASTVLINYWAHSENLALLIWLTKNTNINSVIVQRCYNIEVLNWMHNNKWNLSEILHTSICCGRIDIAEWAISKGYQLHKPFSWEELKVHISTVAVTVKWACIHGFINTEPTKKDIAHMFYFSSINMKNWLLEKKYTWQPEFYEVYLQNHNYESFVWAVKKKLPIPSDLCVKLASAGLNNVLLLIEKNLKCKCSYHTKLKSDLFINS